MTNPRALLAAAVVVIAAATPALATANPLLKNTVGGGTVSGSIGCNSSDATATGTVFNTVITGYVGDIALHVTCAPDSLVLTATGDAVTGSTLRCPELVGTTTTTDGVTTHVEAVGECRINNFPTIVRWRIDGGAGLAGKFSVELA